MQNHAESFRFSQEVSFGSERCEMESRCEPQGIRKFCTAEDHVIGIAIAIASSSVQDIVIAIAIAIAVAPRVA